MRGALSSLPPLAPTMDLLERIYTLLTLYACISVVIATPAFEGISSWSSIGSLVPGLSTLEAIGPRNMEVGGRNYVSIAAPWGKYDHCIRVESRLSMKVSRQPRKCYSESH